MPIATHKVITPAIPIPETPVIEPAHYEGIVRNTQTSSTLALSAYVEGASWTIDEYFGQLLGKHNDLREVDTDAPNVYQQYQLIENMEIKVNSDLSNSYNEEDATMQVSGSGTMYNVIVPKKADYFVVKAFRGRKTIFKITSVTRSSHNSETVYEVSYDVIGYADTQPEIYDQLKEKAVRKYVFVKDRLINGLTPLVRPEARDTIMNAVASYTRLAKSYTETFFSREASTLLLPGQTCRIYDQGLVAFVLKTISGRIAAKINDIRQLPTDSNAFLLQSTVLGAILSKNIDELYTCRHKSMVMPRGVFITHPYGRGAAYTPVDYFVFPKDLDLSAMPSGAVYPTMTYEEADTLINTTNSKGQTLIDLNSSYTEEGWTVPTIHPVLEDDYYIFSENFYTDTSTKSLLETVVLDYINKRALNPQRVSHLLSDYYKWPRLEQFYYGPILLILVHQLQFEN